MHKRRREMTMEELEKNSRTMTPEEIKKFNEEVDLTVYPVVSPKKQTAIDLSPEEAEIFKETIMTENNGKRFKIDDDYLKELDDYSFAMQSAGRRRRRKTRKNSSRRGKKSRAHKKRRTHRKR